MRRISFHKKRLPKRRIFPAALALLAILLLPLPLSRLLQSEDTRFSAFVQSVLKEELSQNALTLHYTLASPEAMDISRPEAALAPYPSSPAESLEACQSLVSQLQEFDSTALSPKNQITLDHMLLYYHTRLSLDEDLYLLQEPLGPSLGIQAQLPVLLAEYEFREYEDITDYLNLLTSVDTYFQSILAFEQQKSKAGCFMSDATVDRILEQCRAFIQTPEENYLLELFAEKIREMGTLSEADQESLNAAHQKIVENSLLPAYQSLIAGLEELRGTGKSSRGLAWQENGRAFYEYLLQSQVGTYVNVDEIQQRLAEQLTCDLNEMSELLKTDPGLLTGLTQTDLPSMETEEILELLQGKTAEIFPPLSAVQWEIRQVHESMEDYLSPAFYLTPPTDTGTPNVIYINQASQTSHLELFVTLAHEGFPGHLYQTVFFSRTGASPLRSLLGTEGYTEGWATYVEAFSYAWAAEYMEEENAASITRLAWLNRSVNLCIYSLLDTGIHYYGWNQTQAGAFLSSFGITDTDTVREIFQYIVETPANYLKYYWGYINFLDLKNQQEENLGSDFDLEEFHARVLEIGPVPFPVLEKYVKNGF